MNATRTFCALALAASLAFAVPPMPDHRPDGADRPLEIGDHFVLLNALAHDDPSFASPSRFVESGRKAELLSVDGGFYQVKIEATDGQAQERLWIWRSELGLRELAEPATKPAVARQVDGALDLARPLDLPQAGDTLELANPVIYERPDLLGVHRLRTGRVQAIVRATESDAGFLELLLIGEDGERGWLYRGELPEVQRRERGTLEGSR